MSFRPRYHRISRLLIISWVLVAVIFFPFAVQAGGAANTDPIWGASRNSSQLPAWLNMRQDPRQLYSEYELSALAGHLINDGVARASWCSSGGLAPDGKANPCGVRLAAPAVFAWQNQFNAQIIAASDQAGVPPLLLKNIFAWESQFWPDTIYVHTWEYGFGHLTQMGADSLLRWNYPFYVSFCSANISQSQCDKYYIDQPDYLRGMLQGAVLQQVDATCAGCSYGLDIQRAENSIPLFAGTLIANAKLVNHYIKAYTGLDGGQAASYEDLWKFTLISYNAGPGCFKTALSRTVYNGMPLNWKSISSLLDPACQGAIPYVKFVSNTDNYRPQDAPAATATLPAPAVTITVPPPALPARLPRPGPPPSRPLRPLPRQAHPSRPLRSRVRRPSGRRRRRVRRPTISQPPRNLRRPCRPCRPPIRPVPRLPEQIPPRPRLPTARLLDRLRLRR